MYLQLGNNCNTNTQILKYTTTQIHKYTTTQIHKYTNVRWIRKWFSCGEVGKAKIRMYLPLGNNCNTNTQMHKYTNVQIHKCEVNLSKWFSCGEAWIRRGDMASHYLWRRKAFRGWLLATLGTKSLQTVNKENQHISSCCISPTMSICDSRGWNCIRAFHNFQYLSSHGIAKHCSGRKILASLAPGAESSSSSGSGLVRVPNLYFGSI